MAKKKSETTEIKVNPVEAALECQYKGVEKMKLDAAGEMLADVFFKVENAREDWLMSVITFSFLAIAIKPKVGHGKFRPWLEESIKTYKSKCGTRSTFDEGQSLETAIKYISYGRKILKQMESPSPQSNFGKRLIEYCEETNTAEKDLPALLQTEDSMLPLLKVLLKGYSLRSLGSALIEEPEDEDEHTLEPDGNGGYTLPKKKHDKDSEDEAQLTFFEQLEESVEHIKKSRESNQGFLHLSKHQLVSLGQRMMSEAKVILDLAKNKED